MKTTITAALSQWSALFFALVIAFVTPAQAADEDIIFGEDLTLEDVAYSDTEIKEFKAKLKADKELLKQVYTQDERASSTYNFDLVFDQALQLPPEASAKMGQLYSNHLSNLILTQQPSPINDIRIMAFLKYNDACNDDIFSQYIIGTSFSEAPSKSIKDTKRMYYWLTRATNNKSDFGSILSADYFLGKSYLTDLIDHPDNRRLKALARQYLTQYAERAMLFSEETKRHSLLPQAALALSDYYSFLDKNEVQAAKWTKISAENGNSRGAGRLALMYAQGQGVPTNYKQAFNWAQKSAKAEDSFGTFVLGLLYEEGWGTKINSRKALSNYSKACELGEAQACQSYNTLYSILNHKTLEEQAELYLTK